MERRVKVELFEHIRGEYEFGWGRSVGWRVSWASTAEWYGRRWLMHDRRSASRHSGSDQCLMGSSHSLRECWKRTAKRRANNATPRIESGSGLEARCGSSGGRVDDPGIRARKEAAVGMVSACDLCASGLCLGRGAKWIGYEAWAELDGVQVPLQVFSMRSMASGAAFHPAYCRATQQAFLESHEQAFA